MSSAPPLLFVPVGTNGARLFGMDARTRACRLAANAGFECREAEPQSGALVASLDFAWDPAWLTEIAGRPSSVLTWQGPVLAHVHAQGVPPPSRIGGARFAGACRQEAIEAETVELANASCESASGR